MGGGNGLWAPSLFSIGNMVMSTGSPGICKDCLGASLCNWCVLLVSFLIIVLHCSENQFMLISPEEAHSW